MCRAGGVKSQFEASRTDAVVRRRSNDRVNENINIYVQEKQQYGGKQKRRARQKTQFIEKALRRVVHIV